MHGCGAEMDAGDLAAGARARCEHPASMDADCAILADGPWRRVEVRWLPEHWRPSAAQEPAIAAAWDRLAARPGIHLFDGPLARLAGYASSGGTLSLTLQPTSYRPFIGTNGRFALGSPDLPDAGGPGAEPPATGEACADPLGTSALVVSADGWLLLGRRSAAVALHPGMVHPFGGGHEPGDGDDVIGGVRRELAEELGLSGADLGTVAPLTLVREPCLRQPELICAAMSRLDAEALAARLDRGEHGQLWRVRLDAVAGAIAGDGLTPMARAALAAWLRHHRALQAGPA